MPDHVHLILTPANNYDRQRVWTLAEILWAIKSASAHRINKALNRSGKVWQDEYFDHILRSSESLNGRIDYVRQNPVESGAGDLGRRVRLDVDRAAGGGARGSRDSGGVNDRPGEGAGAYHYLNLLSL